VIELWHRPLAVNHERGECGTVVTDVYNCSTVFWLRDEYVLAVQTGSPNFGVPVNDGGIHRYHLIKGRCQWVIRVPSA
jgi:hypothetical protein